MKKFLIYFAFETAFIFIVGYGLERMLGFATDLVGLLISAVITGAIIAGVMTKSVNKRCVK